MQECINEILLCKNISNNSYKNLKVARLRGSFREI